MTENSSRSLRLEARIAPRALAVVKRAAEMQGRSVSDFVVTAAQDAAEKTIAEAQIVRLSLADQRAFAGALLKPPAPSRALKRAKERHRRLIQAAR